MATAVKITARRKLPELPGPGKDTMTLNEFVATISAADPPEGIGAALLALWHDGRGDWDKAHQVAQDVGDLDAAWVHAYLHRKEGDTGNAAYWYRRADKPVATSSLEAEWEQIVSTLLSPA
jgi:hypothetical protein